MFRFHILRSLRDFRGHLILILLPVAMIVFMSYVYGRLADGGVATELAQTAKMLTIGLALAFQIYGSANSFEYLGQDFLTPMRDRLLAIPVNPRKIVLSVMFSGIVVGLMQTLAVLISSNLILGAEFSNPGLIIAVMLISVVFNQLLGVVILFLTGKVNIAIAITSLYATIAPALAGVYYPLPDNMLFNFFRDYATPMSLAQTAIKGVINQDITKLFIGVTPLIILSVILFVLLKPLSRKVIS